MKRKAFHNNSFYLFISQNILINNHKNIFLWYNPAPA